MRLGGTMDETERVSRLIGDVYDAALNHALWPGVLRDLARFVGGPAASLFSKDANSKTGGVAFEFGIDPHYKQSYFQTYIKLDPATTGHYFAELENPVSTADLVPYDEFLETRFYREWARPQGLVDFVSAVLDKSTTGAAMFGVFRHERDGVVDDETRRRMRLVIPHIRRAILIGRTIDIKTAEAASLADTLDGVSAGMFLVDGSGRIVHANASGHAMLSEGAILRAPVGRLTANEAAAEKALNDVIAAAGGGDAAVGVKGIALPLAAANGDRYVAHVLPLTSGSRRRAGASYAAVAALFVHKAALDLPSPPQVIAQTYKLTPSELRILLAIVEVGGVPETAQALGIAETTVKTHLHRVFAKTGSNRQADLVKLVASYATPLVG
jgi:DNA-binding CsgD family transcriptional regulator